MNVGMAVTPFDAAVSCNWKESLLEFVVVKSTCRSDSRMTNGKGGANIKKND